MTAFTPVDPANPQRETIYTQLKNAIINGDIAPDERIVETKYADIFRVSRTPVCWSVRGWWSTSPVRAPWPGPG